MGRQEVLKDNRPVIPSPRIVPEVPGRVRRESEGEGDSELEGKRRDPEWTEVRQGNSPGNYV